MSVASEKILIDQKANEVKAFYEIKRMIEKIYNGVARTERKIEFYQSCGLFDSIPSDTKLAYNRLYVMALSLKSAFESDPDFTDLIDQG